MSCMFVETKEYLNIKTIRFEFERKKSASQVNLTSTFLSISCKTLFAGTSVRSNSIFALGIKVTSISADSTLVDI